MALFLALVFIASVVGNILVLFVFFKRSSLLTISNRFIVNLTVCNCLNTAFVMPFVFISVSTKKWLFGDAWCQATGFFMNVVFGASTLTLVVISLDRYCAVVTPLHYKLWVTTRRLSLAIMAVWTIAVMSSLPPLLGWNHIEFQTNKMVCTVKWANRARGDRYYTLFLVNICFVLPLIAMLWTYSVIFRAARSNSERTRKSSILPSVLVDDLIKSPLRIERRRSSSSTAPILIRRLSASSRSNSLLMKMEEWKAALTSFLVLFSFIVCWLPYFVVIVLESTLPETDTLPSALGTTSIVLAMLSCACNPFVYVFRSKLFQVELKDIVFNKRTRVKRIIINRPVCSRRCSLPSSSEKHFIDRRPSLPEPLHASPTTTSLVTMSLQNI